MTEANRTEEHHIPRRIQIDKFTAAEKAIYDALAAVEAAGADTRLTHAGMLLERARNWVADYVDGVDTERYVPYTDVPRPRSP